MKKTLHKDKKYLTASSSSKQERCVAEEEGFRARRPGLEFQLHHLQVLLNPQIHISHLMGSVPVSESLGWKQKALLSEGQPNKEEGDLSQNLHYHLDR